jgi:hypothetical protein
MKAIGLGVLVLSLAACDSDAGKVSYCEYPQKAPAGVVNDPRCPPVYGGDAQEDLCADGLAPCDAPNVTCSYYGVGDGQPGCYVDADAGSADGGARQVWLCAN